jgi:HAE1 family hydrophobic/amphiphilic exporter-1
MRQIMQFANQERERVKSIKVAIVDAIRIRFRPLVTTSTITLVGMLPLAFTEPFWESLAFAIAFGLMSSTIMVIFIFPAYYYVMENVRMKKSRLVLKLRR